MKLHLSSKKVFIPLCLLLLSLLIYKEYSYHVKISHIYQYPSVQEFWKSILLGSAYTALYIIPILTVIGYMLAVIVFGVGHLLIQKHILKSNYTIPISLWGKLNLGLAIGITCFFIFFFLL